MTNFKTELKQLIHLGWPLLIAQITQTLMGVSDTIMAGRFSATDMAAVAIGFSITIPILCFVQGLAMAIPPIVAKLHGAGQTNKAAHTVHQAAYLIIPVSIVIALSVFFVEYWFSLIDMEAKLRTITTDYVKYIVISAPAFAGYQILRNYCEGLSFTKPTMLIMALGLIVNIPANYILIYGKLGLPAMGGVGSGLATSLVFCAMFISTALYIHFSKRIQSNLFHSWSLPNLNEILTTLKLGLPIALTLLFEVTLFGVVALLLSPLGPLTVASHQIALNFSALMFMFPLSLGMATTIRVGHFWGKQDQAGASLAAKTAIILGLSIACVTACITILAKQQISMLYTENQQVIELAMSLMTLAAMFQLSDSVQAISAGALRGYKDTTAMFIITFFAYWGIGLPVGILLALTNVIVPALGASGFWIGFICGLTSAAIMLGIRLNIIQTRLKLHPDLFDRH
ncbi:MATE family efflux transporter [Aliiglaciecola lipolytica]|uniref:Multidrug-efflux transporter n=1 Tax=Aliiglaciecola lipolytica E3 TaxID=1127673 RepID=K6YD42_9ALTE|nr:MATE family efflux transporter [Aliiglaciecola lipolytica]GAC14563.1 multidrug resistance protein mdtK [Aliiglaciecola lipolytica E3]